ncbi:hypothetical protein GGX14DRAFT_401198 [Mycena pura]|uniref:Uncharacterized protein n=1 Tax=Mycena pura TaxID=153505 RepID=A0AAD6Y4Z0_9AGAR|nr:hypothetical protein GGX14DRAFT_401198 [Mycena pura]
MAQSPYSSPDSNSIRASVYDVFLELGALDANSRVADWFFSDPNSDLPDPDEPVARLPREAVRFAHNAQVQNAGGEDAETRDRTSRPSSRSFGLSFSPRRIRSRSKTKIPSPSQTSSPAPAGDGYETDEGYASASPTSTPRISRVRAAFSTKSSRSAETATKPPLPTLPSIQEKPTPMRTVSSPSVTVSKAKSLFRKRAKSPAPGPTTSGDDLQQWHEVAALTPRIFNPSVANGEPLAPAPTPTPAPPSAFRQLVTPSGDNHSSARPERLSFTLPRSVFRTLSLTKRRVTPRPPARSRTRPQSLDLAADQRLATSLPSSPFILVTEGEGPRTTTPGPQPGTPFVFVTAVDNPTPLQSATARRFSDVTSMTAPLGVYPLSISRTLRRSMAFDKTPVEPAFPRLRHSSSYSSLEGALALAATAASPYEMYNQPIPAIRRGVESPFPVRPILPQPLSMSTSRAGLQESRLATIQRYREFSEQLVEVMPYKRFTQDTRN